MNKELKLAQELIDFVYKSPNCFYAVKNIEIMLKKCGFNELKEEDKWNLKKGEKYFVTKNNSAIIAFVIGKGDIIRNGFKIIGTHTDSPTFRIKPSPEIISEDAYIKINTEVYGGPILNTWLDRPLSLAGRVVLKSNDIMKPEIRLVNIQKPILIIPNLAIHMNKNINKGIELNKQKDMLPLLCMVSKELEKGNYLLNILSDELNVDIEDILDFDLFLYEFEKGKIIGANNDFISSSRLDDLSMVYAGAKGLIDGGISNSTNVLVCFDNEEIGSSSKQGANSPILASVLQRIVLYLKKDIESYYRTLNNSFMISADLAHAVHPNSLEKSDPTNRPVINKGPVIKINANQNYTSDSISCAIYEQICKKAQVPVQKFTNRSDERGGSTIGPISSTHVPISSIDIGSPILAMHSIRELGGVKDNMYIIKSFKEFYKL